MKKIILFLSLSLLISTTSCSDFLDVNDNQNKALYSQLKPSELLGAAQASVYDFQATTLNEYGNVQTNAWAGNVAQYGNVYPNYYQFILTPQFGAGIWGSLYSGVNNFVKISSVANTDHKNDNYVAASLICKVHYMQYIVDLYGDCPFTGAFLGTSSGANLTPTYNDDQRIYRLLIADLESAKNLILAANPTAESIAGADVMLAGVMSDWYAFADTIELRMLLRMSNFAAATPAGIWRDAKLVNLVSDAAAAPGNPYLVTDVSINPGYSKATPDTLSPFYQFVGRGNNPVAPADTQNWSFITTSGHAYKCMNTYAAFAGGPNNSTLLATGLNYPNVSDPRYARMTRNGTQQTVRRAVTQGSTNVDVFASGVPGAPAKGCQGNGILNPYGLITVVGSFADYGAANGYVMTKAEAFFIFAEAGLRGYAGFTPANAIINYNSGIDASFEYLQGPTFSSIGYKGAIANKIGFSMLAAGATPSQKLQGLMYQKWVALMGIHGVESYLDYLRTGFPITPLPIVPNGGSLPYTNRPYRLMYPQSELIANGVNTIPITDAECFSINSKSPFWLQGNPVLGN